MTRVIRSRSRSASFGVFVAEEGLANEEGLVARGLEPRDVALGSGCRSPPGRTGPAGMAAARSLRVASRSVANVARSRALTPSTSGPASAARTIVFRVVRLDHGREAALRAPAREVRGSGAESAPDDQQHRVRSEREPRSRAAVPTRKKSFMRTGRPEIRLARAIHAGFPPKWSSSVTTEMRRRVAAPVGERERLDLAVGSRQDLARGRRTVLDLRDDAHAGLPQRGEEAAPVCRRARRPRAARVLRPAKPLSLGGEDLIEDAAHAPDPREPALLAHAVEGRAGSAAVERGAGAFA